MSQPAIQAAADPIAVAASQQNSPCSAEPFAPWPQFSEEEIAAAGRVLASGKVNYWTGPEGRQFEEEFAAYTGCQHAIALANGTVALELALHALELRPGDEVVVPSRTFIASASCVVACGGVPVMADVDRDSQNLTAETVAEVLTPRTRGIIAVHLAGWPCDMDSILALARSRNLFVVEDCAQAHGARYRGKPIGSLGDMAAFSFCQDKILTTAGEGGMLVTNRTELWDRAWRYKDHGKTPEAFYQPQPAGTQFRWLHESFGTNMRMTEIQSALGRIVLRKLPGWTRQRQAHTAALRKACQAFPALRTPEFPAEVEHACYKFYTFVRPECLATGWSRDRILEEIRSLGVPCFSGSCSEIYLEEAFPEAWRPRTRLPHARELGETSLMFLVHPTLTENNIARTQAAIQQVLSRASRSAQRAA